MLNDDGWICTYSGKKFHPLAPDITTIDLTDIAHALSQVSRFSGHTKRFYSVAEHSVRVYEWLRYTLGFRTNNDILAQAIMHDASEAYLNDVCRPVKHLPAMQPYRSAEWQLELVIASRYGYDPSMYAEVKEADEVLLVTEARDLMFGFDERWAHWNMREKAIPARIDPWCSEYAKQRFYETAKDVIEANGGRA